MVLDQGTGGPGHDHPAQLHGAATRREERWCGGRFLNKALFRPPPGLRSGIQPRGSGWLRPPEMGLAHTPAPAQRPCRLLCKPSTPQVTRKVRQAPRPPQSRHRASGHKGVTTVWPVRGGWRAWPRTPRRAGQGGVRGPLGSATPPPRSQSTVSRTPRGHRPVRRLFGDVSLKHKKVSRPRGKVGLSQGANRQFRIPNTDPDGSPHPRPMSPRPEHHRSSRSGARGPQGGRTDPGLFLTCLATQIPSCLTGPVIAAERTVAFTNVFKLRSPASHGQDPTAQERCFT